ncbi:MAG: efflux RND transporter periplasmic adaptor subunit [Pirellulaceae bacterium]|nr:efflux RND transporter periplasmic adaptor subunit [Pirellulaceae bacterium]
MRSLSSISLCLASALLAGCSPTMQLPPAVAPEVTAAPAITRQVVDFDEYTGRIQSPEYVELRARVSGYLLEVKFGDGDMVTENELLMVIDPSTYKTAYDEAKAQADAWRPKLKFAEDTRARNEALVGKGSVTKEEYERTVAQRDEAAASLAAAEAEAESRRLDWEFCFVKSPINGRIDRRFVTRGNLVQSGPAATLLTRIVSVDPIYVYFDVDERAYLRYTKRRQNEEGVVNRIPLREKKIPVQITLADDSIFPDIGIIDFASNEVDPGTGTVTARAVVANTAATLTPGLFVRAKITADRPYDAVLVDEQAIGTDQSERFVYVVDAGNVAKRRKVVLGSRQGTSRVIKEGVKEGEQVIINGLLLMRPDKEVRVVKGTMAEPPPVDDRLLRPEPSPGETPAGSESANPAISPRAEGEAATPLTTPATPHSVRKPAER